MSNRGHDIVAIGASLGGLEALEQLVGQLPGDLPASLFIVQHLAPEATGAALLHRLSQRGKLRCELARHGEQLEKGRIYIAPADYHLLVKAKTVLVTKGARENRYRPAVDPLFRSAAVAHGPAVIGVVLTGTLDDGTAGLVAIKKCGGITVVQDPNDAAYPEMPQSAINHLEVDHCVPLALMGRLLEALVHEPVGESQPIPEDIRTEAQIAERVLSDIAQVNALGSPAPYSCPDCGGVLWEMNSPDLKRFRCHTGHSFTAAELLAGQSEKFEETMWMCLRMLEERNHLLNNMAEKERRGTGRRSYAARVKETEEHIERLREILLTPEAA